MNSGDATRARSRARELAVQALYQMQISGHTKAELVDQFRGCDEYDAVDQDYFDEVIAVICREQESLKQNIDRLADRPVAQLDPVELAILLLGFYELEFRIDVPFRVVINEAVNLSKKFGAVDGHKYVNAILDRAAAKMRSAESR